MCSFAEVGFPPWTSPAPILQSYLDSAIVTCQAPEHDGTQKLPGYDCCSFQIQFFLDPVPGLLDIEPGKGFSCFHSQVSLGPGNHTSIPGGLIKTSTVCLSLA